MAGPLAALLACATGPFALSEFHATVAGYVGIAAIVTLGLVMLTGIAGQTSFGQATFLGLAAYATATLTRAGWPPVAGLAAGLAVTGGTAFLLGLITSRISGHYLPLATIAWCVSFYHLFGVIPALGGFNGFGGIPPLLPGITRAGSAALIGVVFVLAYVLCANLLSSRTGRGMRALAHGRIMAESVGIDTARLARATFVLAALLAGVAGWLYAHVQQYVSPAPFGLSASIEYVFMAVIGGATRLAGAAIGAAVVVVLRDQLNEWLPHLLGSTGNFETVAFSLGVILLLHHAPLGIAPWLFRRARRPPPSAAAVPLARRTMPRRGALVLEVSGVEKRFGGLLAARDITLSVHAGEVVALIGPNGAGKSTTFNLISGVLAPGAGSIGLLGRDIHGQGARIVAGCGLARTFQHVKLLPEASVLDNVALGAHGRGRAGMVRSMLRLDRAEEAAILHAARVQAERVGLGDALHEPAGSLPLGRQRLIEIARGLCLDPCVFLLDEPAAGLRLQEKQALAGLLHALRDDGMAILLVEHDMEFVMGLADRVVVMDFGEKIADGRPDQVQGDRAVQEAYLGGVA
jgi:branched-chain amino acid transport system permease protein